MTDIHSCSYYCDRPDCIKAQRDELRERLAQPEQEPGQEPFGYFRYDPRLDAWVQNREGRPGTPFYTTPPQRKPLTDEEIEKIRTEQEFDRWGISEGAFKYAARAVEAAHGIKGHT